jgi:hypothetical protein
MAVPIIFGIAEGISLLGSAFQGAGEKQQAEAQARADEENARLLRQRAFEVERQGGQRAGQVRQAGSQAIAAQKVAFAAGGVDPSSGTAASLAADSRVQSEIDAMRLRYNAALESRGIRTQAGQLDAHAGQARTAGDYGLAGSLLGGLGNAAGMAYGYLQPKIGSHP